MISVALCTYNGEKFIAQQLLSIIEQTKKVDEIIICDDSSSDNTVSIAAQLLTKWNQNHKIIINTPALGITKNFEKCISECQGDIIFLSDQDDIWRKDKVAVLMESFDDPNVVLAFSDAQIIDSKNQIITGSFFEKNHCFQTGTDSKQLRETFARKFQGINGCFMAFRRNYIHEVIPFFNFPGNSLYHDAWIQYCASLFGKIAVVREPLTLFRIHGNNVSQGIEAQDQWSQKVHNCNEYELRFGLHLFREQRILMMEKACELSANKQKKQPPFFNDYKKAIRIFHRLKESEGKSFLHFMFVLFISLFDGSYSFRETSKNIEFTLTNQFKLLISDIIFYRHWIKKDRQGI